MNIPAKWAMAFLVCGVAVNGANAAYPDKPVHIVVGHAPGGGADTLTRVLAQKLQEKWGQNVIVDTKAGAEGVIAADITAHAPPDGYTIMGASSTFMLPGSEIKLNYDPIASFAPITLVSSLPQVLITAPTLPVESLNALVAYAKAHPGQLNFGSGGTTSPAYLEMALLMKLTGINMVNISYKGNALAVVALLGGEIQAMFAGPINVVEQLKSGKLRALGISTKQRLPLMPDVPTIAELTGLPFDAGSWNGFFTPAGTPRDIVNRLHDDIVAVTRSADVQQRLTSQGFVTIADTPEEFAAFLKDDLAMWTGIQKTVQGK